MLGAHREDATLLRTNPYPVLSGTLRANGSFSQDRAARRAASRARHLCKTPSVRVEKGADPGSGSIPRRFGLSCNPDFDIPDREI